MPATASIVLQRIKKSPTFFIRFKTRHIFCENSFSQKTSLCSSKSLIPQAFLMAIYPIRGGHRPLELPFCCMGFSHDFLSLTGFSAV